MFFRLFLLSSYCVPKLKGFSLLVSSCFWCSRKLNCVILKKIGKISGDENQVKSRIRHILSTIDKKLKFSISEVRVRGTWPQPPIYEVVIDELESAIALRQSFS